jgi:hypothetical protein
MIWRAQLPIDRRMPLEDIEDVYEKVAEVARPSWTMGNDKILIDIELDVSREQHSPHQNAPGWQAGYTLADEGVSYDELELTPFQAGYLVHSILSGLDDHLQSIGWTGRISKPTLMS